jgi:hypothetical protein
MKKDTLYTIQKKKQQKRKTRRCCVENQTGNVPKATIRILETRTSWTFSAHRFNPLLSLLAVKGSVKRIKSLDCLHVLFAVPSTCYISGKINLKKEERKLYPERSGYIQRIFKNTKLLANLAYNFKKLYEAGLRGFFLCGKHRASGKQQTPSDAKSLERRRPPEWPRPTTVQLRVAMFGTDIVGPISL